MMKHCKRGLSLALALALCLGLLAAPAAASSGDIAFGGNSSPIVIIHGNTQSDVYLYEDDNVTRVLDADGNPIQNWGPKVDANALLQRLLFPLLLSLIFQKDVGLTKALRTAISEALPLLEMDDNGMPANNMRVESYLDANGIPQSLAECSPEMREAVYKRLRIHDRDPRVTDGMIYYFAYDTFGNTAYNTKACAEYIEAVSAKHNGAKVNVTALSLGGTIVNGLMHDYYERIVPLLGNVVLTVAAMDGTNLVGDVYTKQLNTGDEALYRDMFPALLETFPGKIPAWALYLVPALLRIFPKQVLKDVLDAFLDGFVGDVVAKNTTIWSLVPSAYYEDARTLWLADESRAAIRAQTDNYYEAQKASRANLQRMRADGVRVYDVCIYDFKLISVAGSSEAVNADGILHFDSTSLGAAAGYIGTPLPQDYTTANPNCTDPAHNHRSPDGIVDAAAGALPDQTWFFKGGMHDRIKDDDRAMALVFRLLTSDEYESVYSMPAWPQFNTSRNSRTLRITLLPLAEEVDTAALAEADAAELAAAIAEAKAALANTIATPEEFDKAQGRLTALLVKLGLTEEVKPDRVGDILTCLFSFLNDTLYRHVGPRGYSDAC